MSQTVIEFRSQCICWLCETTGKKEKLLCTCPKEKEETITDCKDKELHLKHERDQ